MEKGCLWPRSLSPSVPRSPAEARTRARTRRRTPSPPKLPDCARARAVWRSPWRRVALGRQPAPGAAGWAAAGLGLTHAPLAAPPGRMDGLRGARASRYGEEDEDEEEELEGGPKESRLPPISSCAPEPKRKGKKKKKKRKTEGSGKGDGKRNSWLGSLSSCARDVSP